MRKDDKYLKELFEELPQDKAPMGITQLIMNKIEERRAVLSPTKKMYFWQTQAFYIMIAIVVAESWLFYNIRGWLTMSNIIDILTRIYVAVVEYIATYNFNIIFVILAIVAVLIYLLVKDCIENTRCCSGKFF